MNFWLIKKYLQYKLSARHKHGHGIHSPFLYDLLVNVIENKSVYYAFEEIENLRQSLLDDHDKIQVSDFGAGSKKNKSDVLKISYIAKVAAITPKFGKLIFRLVNHFKPSTILELGTSLGIGTLYLAKSRSSSTVYTIEGCPEISKIALLNFKLLKANNIELINGKFDDILPGLLNKIEKLDFVYFDGNHRKEPTLQYFRLCLEKIHNDSVFIFDDIRWSKEMEESWIEIVKHPCVTASIDLFFVGIVFFRKEMQQQNFVIKF